MANISASSAKYATLFEYLKGERGRQARLRDATGIPDSRISEIARGLTGCDVHTALALARHTGLAVEAIAAGSRKPDWFAALGL